MALGDMFAGENLSPQAIDYLKLLTANTPRVPPAPGPSMGGPVPGDPNFAASVLGGAGPAGPPPPPSAVPRGPAPGEPGFGLGSLPSMPPAAAKAGPPAGAPVINVPKGAGSVDTSMVAPAGYGSGAVTLKNVPSGAGSVDLSGITPPRGAAEHSASAESGPGVAQGHYVGAQWVPGSRSETRQHGVDPAALEEGRRQRAEGDWMGTKASQDVRVAAQREAEGDVAYAAARQDALQAEAARQQRIESEKQAYVTREHEKLDSLATAAQQQIDPEAAKGSLGAQILAALAVGLGQFGSSLGGGTNTALQIVNGNIDRRIAAQQYNINNAHKALGNEQSLYKDNLAAFGDKGRASAATKIQMIDQAKALLEEQYAGAKSNRNEAQYHAMLQGLADRRAESADKFGIITQDQVTTSGNEHFAPGGMVGGAGSTATPEAKKDAHGYAEALEKAGIPASLAGLQDVDQRLDALGTGDVAGIGPVASHVPALLTSKEGVANRQAVAHIKNAMRKDVAGASLTPGEKAELDKDLEGAGDAASLRNFVQSYRRKLSNQQKSLGAGFSPEGRALYHQRGGTVDDIETSRGTTPYQRPVKDTGDADEAPSGTVKHRSKK